MNNDIKDWKSAITKGLAFREEVGHSQDWDKYRAAYRGDFSVKLFYNLIFACIRTIIPNTYFRNPVIDVSATFNPQLYWHAKLVESLDNYLLPQLGMKQMVKKTILDTLFCGSGFSKIGYQSEYGFDPTIQSNPLDPEADKTKLDKKKSRDGQRIEYNKFVQDGMPWVLRCQPDCIILPYGATSMTDVPWIAHIVYRLLSDVQADMKYSNTKDLKGTHIELLKDKYPGKLYMGLNAPEAEEWVELIEIRDFKRGEIKTLVADVADDWVRKPQEDPLQVTGLPFEMMCWNDDPEWAWGVSDMKQIMPQQSEANAIRTYQRWHRMQGIMKMLYRRGAFKDIETTIAKLESDDFGGMIEMEDIGADAIRELVHSMPPDLIIWFNQIVNDAREILGLSRMNLGEFAPGGSHRTGTEVMKVSEANTIRLDEKRDAVADFVVGNIKKVNQVVFKMWTNESVIQMVGQEGAVYWVQYTPNAIKGDYTLKIDVESMTPASRQSRKRELMEVLQVMGQYPNANVDLLTRQLLKEYDWADVMSILPQANPGQPPMSMDNFQSQQAGLQANPKALLERRQGNAAITQKSAVRR